MPGRDLLFPSSEGRMGTRHIFWSGKRGKFLFMVGKMFFAVQCLFVCDISYIMGSFFKEDSRIHHLKVLMVNYDNGALATAMRTAFKSMESESFPTSYEFSPAQYPQVSDILHEVYRGEYWGAIYTHPGASDRLVAALNGEVSAYNASDVVTYIWNEARYPTTGEAYIQKNLEQCISITTAMYYEQNGTYAFSAVSAAGSASHIPMQTLYNPISITSYNIKPTTQGVRVVYGAIPMVMSILIQFFFLMAVNGISSHLQVYSHLTVAANGAFRLALSLIYTFFGSMCFAGLIWAFQENWDLPTHAYFEMWMVFWLHMHINFCVIDVATAVVPIQFLSFAVLTWVLINISTTLTPFELVNGFYKWGYALPAHETYTILIQIWSNGACNYLYRALPILFADEVVALFAAYMALNYRCRTTRQAVQQEKLVEKEVGEDDGGLGVTFRLQALMNRERQDEEQIDSQYFPAGIVAFDEGKVSPVEPAEAV